MKLMWKIFLGSAVVLCLFAALLALSYSAIVKQVDARTWTIHTHKVIEKSDAILADLINIETGLRGYALTGKDVFLEPLTSGIESLQIDLDSLKALTSDNQEVQSALTKLQDEIRHWLRMEVYPLIGLRREVSSGLRPIEAVLDFIDAETGKHRMDTMRDILSGMRQEETSLLDARQAEMADLTRTTKGVIGFGGIATILVGALLSVLMAWGVTRPLKKVTAYAKKVTEGEYSVRLDLDSRDETGILGDALRSMVDKLTRHIAMLDQHSQDLKRLNLELDSKNRELDEFAHLASHDLKEPLRGIHNYASFLKEDYAHLFDNEGKNYLERMQRLTERLASLIDFLRSYSRLGKSELAMEVVDVKAVVDRVEEELEPYLAEQGVELRVGPLPKTRGNAACIGEVFLSLISNAAKYNDKAVKRVEIGCREDETPPVFYVQDNGIGIRPEHRERVFRIFKRLHEQSKYGGGTGAGLAITKKIIERHDGRIWLESAPGVGTTFYFTLAGGS